MKRLLYLMFTFVTATSLFAQDSKLQKLKPLKEKYLMGTLVPVEKKGMWGYGLISEDGKKTKVVIKEIFEEVRSFNGNIAIVKYEGRYGLLQRNGTMCSMPIYDELHDFKAGVALAKIGNTHIKLNTDAVQICRWTSYNDGTRSYTYKDETFYLKPIAPGNFEMGGSVGNSELDYDSPKHDVNITKTFYMGESEVTQSLWAAVMNNNPSKSKGSLKPVENITWDDCHVFMKRLGDIFNTEFRLPTEAEWEYAAYGGKSNSIFSGSDNKDDVCWYENNCSSTQDVMRKTANGYGLYDMSGNVAEWCSDWYNSFYYKECPYNDPIGAPLGKGRVVRGGDWKSADVFAKVVCRNSHDPKYKGGTVGMRLAQ